MIGNLIAVGCSALAFKLFSIRKPLVLSISITSRCNLKCWYCYSNKDNLNSRDVPADEACRTIDSFHELGTRVVILQGGEPLLHGELASIIDHVKAKGMYCAVTTNGIHLAQQIDALKRVDQVQLSIDGGEEITDRNRGKGVYAALLEAVKLCDLNRIPFHLHTVITNDSTVENTLQPLLTLAGQFSTHLNFCFPAPTGSALNAEAVSGPHLASFYKAILTAIDQGAPINNSRHAIREVIAWAETRPLNSLIDKGGETDCQECLMGNLVCWLDSEGMLHPCAARFGQEEFAYSIREKGVAEAWRKLADKPCHYCASSTEFNSLFQLRLESLMNSLKFLSRIKPPGGM